MEWRRQSAGTTSLAQLPGSWHQITQPFLGQRELLHHNPVHHGYVEKWQDWPWSSAAAFIDRVGHQTASKIWREYPILDYGKKWDFD